MIFDPQPWMVDAACAHLDLTPRELDRLFFPARGETADQARAICAGCPVRKSCLDYAVTTRQAFGIWGGTSEMERRAIRHERGLGRAHRQERETA
jgi:WhiB family redox-sensing transcriptional regulator